jgi:tetratricopeptide (TPR) repeat protein
MIRLFRGDFRALAIACGESPSYAHDLCFRSMGRDVGDWTTGRPEKAIEYCGYLQDEMNRARCIYGAAEAWFWEASGAAPTIRMCRLASETASKAACYRASIERARYLVETPAQMASFCAAVEPGYQAACLRPVHGGLWETFRAAGYEAYEQGNYPEAEKQLAAAVKEAEWFGPLDPHLAMSLNDLGEVYRRQLRYAEAEALHKRALAIREKTLGPDHPDVARSLENYAALLRETGRGAEANEMEAHAKAVRARHAEENPAN